MIQHRDIRRQQLLSDDDGFVGKLNRFTNLAEQSGQQAASDVFHVGGAFLQVSIVHSPKRLHVVRDDLFDRGAGASSVVNV